MTREELKEHCEKQIQYCEQWAEWNDYFGCNKCERL